MDIKEKILLGSERNVDSVNVDNNIKIELETSQKKITEYDVTNILDVTNQYVVERENTEKYRLHGKINYLSPLAGMPLDYNDRSDFFLEHQKNIDNTKNLLTDFRFLLVKPVPPEGTFLADGQNESEGYPNFTNATDRYLRNYEVIVNENDLVIRKAGFDRNVFNDDIYTFIVDVEVDIKDKLDGLGIPITDVYLYAEYKTDTSSTVNNSVLRRRIPELSDYGNFVSYNPVSQYEIGDVITGDIVTYNLNDFTVSTFRRMEYEVIANYSNNSNNFHFIYKPFIPIKLRTLSDDLETVNTGSTSFEDVQGIPSYAKPLDNNGNVVWRNLLPKGFIDPITGTGVDYPFINNRHYVYQNITLSLIPNLNDSSTNSWFDNVEFGNNELISNQPNGLDNIGKKC